MPQCLPIVPGLLPQNFRVKNEDGETKREEIKDTAVIRIVKSVISPEILSSNRISK